MGVLMRERERDECVMSVQHLSQCVREKECVCERREGGELRYKSKQMHKKTLKQQQQQHWSSPVLALEQE